MKSARRLLALLFFCATTACGTVSDWREVASAPMPFGDCYEGLVYIAEAQGFTADVAECDRGLGIWRSRWRPFLTELGRFPARFRVRAEVLIDEGSPAKGWTIRFVVEQQKVKDLRHALDPREGDWSDDGQYREREVQLGEGLAKRLAKKG